MSRTTLEIANTNENRAVRRKSNIAYDLLKCHGRRAFSSESNWRYAGWGLSIRPAVFAVCLANLVTGSRSRTLLQFRQDLYPSAGLRATRLSLCVLAGAPLAATLSVSMPYKDITPPAGEKITRAEKLNVPDRPIIPFIRGDGTGPDIWAASVRVFDAAVEKAYGGKKKISWFEVFAGQAAKDKFDSWLPDDTVEAFREFLIGIKGPLTTPIGGGIRSLNVALRQLLDLFVCLRPVHYFKGVPSPVKHPEKVDMVIFRENTEDIYAGVEWAAGTPESQKVLDFIAKEFPKEFEKIRFGTKEKAAEFWKRVGAPEKTDHNVGLFRRSSRRFVSAPKRKRQSSGRESARRKRPTLWSASASNR